MTDDERSRFQQAAADIAAALEISITDSLAILRRSCRTYADAEQILKKVAGDIAFESPNDFRLHVVTALRTVLKQEMSRQPLAGGGKGGSHGHHQKTHDPRQAG